MNKDFHSSTIGQVFSELKSRKTGLSFNAVKDRLKKHGLNVLPQKERMSKLIMFFRQFTNSLTYIMLAAAVISIVLKHYSDSVFILIVLFLNTLVGFYQENKVNNSLEALKKMIKIRVRVIRGGQVREEDSEKLVVGDVIVLKAGDKVPADARLFEAKDLKINEASLTGEWMAVEKNTKKISKQAAISDMKNMVFTGTAVEYGTGKAIITATGSHTEFGKIVKLVKDTEEPKTPLQKKISQLSKLLAIFILIAIGIILVEGVLTGSDFVEIFIAALALAVSAIPEGLLPATTVVLVLAMRRILKQKGVVKKLSAAEGLGSVTTVCTDKTGTLTEGNMQVNEILTSSKKLLSSDFKNLHKNGTKSNILALKIATLTNDAYIENPDDALHDWVVRGYFTDKALLLAGIQAGLNIQDLEKDYQLIEKLSFSSKLRFGATLRQNKDSKKEQLFVVGAPEELISRSKYLEGDGKVVDIKSTESQKLLKKLEKLTKKGLRVVACAYRDTGKLKNKDNLEKIVEDLTLVGFVALKDPVRKDVKKAMTEIRGAGVHPVIITGDHRFTAQAVAEELGFEVNKENVIEGKDLERMSDGELTEKVKEIVIYARALPEHKLRIVQALHRNDEVVAMFGDGVNDAPALKASDIGVAVGSGTDVAKEVADIILLDDNFKTIVKAIEQGRVAFANIRKIFIYLVADDFTEVLLFLGALFLGLPLPLMAAQILWINLVEDGFPGIALTTEQETEGVMKEPPRDPKEPILNHDIKGWIFSIFLTNGLLTFFFFWIFWKLTGDIDRTRTVTFSLMAFDSLAFAYSVRSLKLSVFRKNIFSNRYLNWSVLLGFVLLLAAVYLPILNKFLSTTPISLGDWGIIVGITFAEVIVFEVFREIFLSHKKHVFHHFLKSR